MRRPAVPMARPTTPPASYDDVPALAPDDEESSATRGQDVMAGRGKIQMKCPACGRRMELDEGFAGSVCRCASCSALISVPSGGDEVEALVPSPTRPDVPLDMRESNPGGSGKPRRRSHTATQTSAPEAGPVEDEASIALSAPFQKDESVAGLLALAKADVASGAVQTSAVNMQVSGAFPGSDPDHSLANWLLDWERSWWAWLGGISLGVVVVVVLTVALSRLG